MPAGFVDAYKTYREGGWVGLTARPVYGGQGLPHAVSIMITEIMCAANLSFSMVTALSNGAYNALDHHATDALKEKFLPKLVEGTWAATMVREKLERDHVHDRLQRLADRRHVQNVVGQPGEVLPRMVGDHDHLAVARPHLLQVAEHLLEHPLAGGDRDRRQILVDERDRSVLHLAGGAAFRVKI